MKLRMLGAAALCSSAFGLSGCATVIHGTHEPMAFRSEPQGALIKLVNGLKCTTPCKYSMKRGDDSRVTFTKDGYKPVTVYIQSRTSGSVAGNILAGGIIGGVVDASNGASNHLYPRPVYIKMVPIGSNDPALLLNDKGTVISTVDEYNSKVADDVNKGLQKQGYYPMGQTAAQ